MKGVPTLYYPVKHGVNPRARGSQISIKVCHSTESQLQRSSLLKVLREGPICDRGPLLVQQEGDDFVVVPLEGSTAAGCL